MLQYKLIVSDFDGTLRRSEGGISEGNIRAVEEYVAAGGEIGRASCRERV